MRRNSSIQRRSTTFRLFVVSKHLDKDGLHKLIPFGPDEFNQEFDEDCIDDELDRLCDYLYGGAMCKEITEDMCDYEGNIYIQFSPNRRDKMTVPDIIGKIDSDPDNSKYYIFVHRDYRYSYDGRKEYLWVVAKQSEAHTV